MKWHRIYALLLRYLYLYPRSVPRILDIFFWPVTDLLVWGFLTIYLQNIQPDAPYFGRMLLGSLILWNFTNRSQQGISIAFLEEIWEKNLINIFITPISLKEFLAATILVGLARIAVLGTFLGTAAFLMFHFNLLSFGWYLVPFILNLFVFGWVLGLFATSIIMRFGQSAQVLAFTLTFILMPFAAVFYPVSVLPPVVKHISLALPISHIFEGMRSVVLQQSLSPDTIVIASVLNIIWLIVALSLFFFMFEYMREKGQLSKLVD